MNIGLFGGTFNPIHFGHIAVITHVKSVFNLDIVYIIPSAIPPHKTTIPLASAKDRFQMVKESFSDMSDIVVSDVELTRNGKSFSIDTIKHFKNIVGSNTQLYFIMGSDAFFDIKTWKNSIDIFKLTEIIVMNRGGDRRNLKDIESFLQKFISANYIISELDDSVQHTGFKTVHICEVPQIDISSTLIREKIKKKESIKELVPNIVESMIYEKRLYIF